MAISQFFDPCEGKPGKPTQCSGEWGIMTGGITRGGVGGGRRMASCVFGAGANELAEASIVASTKVRMTTAATMLVTATAQQERQPNTAEVSYYKARSWRACSD